MDTSLERIAFDMIKELGILNPPDKDKVNVGYLDCKDCMGRIDKSMELYEYTLEKLKNISKGHQQPISE